MTTHELPELIIAEHQPTSANSKLATIKTILVHLQDDESLNVRLDNALAMARACSAHVTCLHITPIEAYVAFDSFGGVFVMNDIIKALDESEAALRSRIEERLRAEDVSWNYEQTTGSAESQIISRAALADIVVVGRSPHRSDFAGPAIGVLGELICKSRTPLFIPSDNGIQCDPNGAALIAWDGSYEAANAVRSAVGLLKLASNVKVLTIQEKDEVFPGTRLLEYLSRYGIHAELSVKTAGPNSRNPEFVAAALIKEALLSRAYLVMGGYNHSRVREYVFGGVTRNMLSGAPVPLLIAR